LIGAQKAKEYIMKGQVRDAGWKVPLAGFVILGVFVCPALSGSDLPGRGDKGPACFGSPDSAPNRVSEWSPVGAVIEDGLRSEWFPIPSADPEPDWTRHEGDSYYGYSVSTAGDVNGDGYDDVPVGAVNTGTQGRAYAYYGSPAGLPSTASWVASCPPGGGLFGNSVSTAGDVNGDGSDDVIISAYGGSPQVLVYHGSSSGLSSTPDWTASGGPSDGSFGEFVSMAGDVNGDGYSDVIVSSNGYSNGEEDEGRVVVYHGSATGLSSTPDWSAESDQAGAMLGRAVSNAGDVNGDGYDDVVVSAFLYDNGQTDEGMVFVYHGSAAGLSLTPSWTAEGDVVNRNMGQDVSPAGDVNGDGFADVAVASGYNLSSGVLVAVYHGSATGLSTTSAWNAEAIMLSDISGRCVTTAGDVNGDGYADLLFPPGNNTASVYQGSGAGLYPSAFFTARGPGFNRFGFRVSTAGDVNGDGYDDVIIGSMGSGVWVYYGPLGPLTAVWNWNAYR